MRRKKSFLLSSSALLLLCLAGVARSETPPESERTTTPEPAPATPTPSPSRPETPAVPVEPPPAQQTTPAAPGTTPVPQVTITAPPAPPAPLPQRPAPTAPPAPATRTPQRTVSTPPPAPAGPSAPAPTQTQIFDQRRDIIFAPAGAATTTWTREDIEALPQGSNTPLENVLLQFPGVSQDAASRGKLSHPQRALESALAFRINGILLPDQHRRLRSIPRPELRRQLEPDHRGAARPIWHAHGWRHRHQDRDLRQ